MPVVILIALTLLMSGCAQAGNHAIGIAAAAPAEGKGLDRKVIQTVHLELRVNSVESIARQLPLVAATARGYVAESYVSQAAHSGEWTIRIPNEELPRFLDVAHQWGPLLSQRATAEDVTEQFMDVTARLSAKQVEEKRLLALLEEATGTLADVLAVEKELQRVRQEIEQAQGRIQFLEHATDLATIHLRAYELFGVSWSDGQPLMAQVGTTFRSSINVLLLFGRGLIVVFAALVPWMIVASFPIACAWRWLRPRRTAPRSNHPTQTI